MRNIFRQFIDLIPSPALQAGTVTQVSNGVALVQLPDGGLLAARGTAAVGDKVFVRNGLVEGNAPALTIEVIEI